MGVAGLVFEPPPPNFEKMHNFPRYTNDIIMNYGYFLWFKSLKKSLGVSFTDILVLLVHIGRFHNMACAFSGQKDTKTTIRY